MPRVCPVADCGTAIAREHLMCHGHWRRVSRPLQAEVNEAWRWFKRDPSVDAVIQLRLAQNGAIADAINKSKPKR